MTDQPEQSNNSEKTRLVLNPYTLDDKLVFKTITNPDNPQSTINILDAGSQVNGYEIQDLIGVGGFGIVYKAYHPKLCRTVALKEYFPHDMVSRQADGSITLKLESHAEAFETCRESFLNEARTLARFDHPSLVRVFDYWSAYQTAYMPMSFLQGRTLQSYIDKKELLTSEEALIELFSQLANALNVMHQERYLHRDISAHNIIIRDDNHKPVLLDFGAARKAAENQQTKFTVFVNRNYAPYEQYCEAPELQQGPWTDVYALGALAYLILKGHAPPNALNRYHNDSITKLVDSELNQTYSKQFLFVIDKTLAVMPANRWQNMNEFVSAIRGQTETQADTQFIQTQHKTNPTQPLRNKSTRKEPGQKSNAKKLIWVTSGILIITLISALMVWWLWPTNAPEVSHAEPNLKKPSKPIEQSLESTQTTVKPLQVTLNSEKRRLRINKDLLKLNITAQQAGHVYLFAETTDDLLLQLSPNQTQTRTQVLSNTTVNFPSDREVPLKVVGPPGMNEFLAVITRNPLPENFFQSESYYDYKKINLTGTNRLSQIEATISQQLGCEKITACSQTVSTDRILIEEYFE